MSKIRPLVLCGGVGTRLWPLSRTLQPKQFQPIGGEGSLSFFQETLQRHRYGVFGEPWICVSNGHIQTVRHQLREIQHEARIIAEPIARNTGPAVLAACLEMVAEDPDAITVVLPSDHVISGEFNQRIAEVREAVESGLIVVFGITPRYPETGYGYIIDDGGFLGMDSVRRVGQFIEKPEEAIAIDLISQGNAYWASGISIFKASTLIAEYRLHDPVTFEAVEQALAKAHRAGSITTLDHHSFEQARNEPTEIAVFERSNAIALAPADIVWDDVGAWAAFHTIGVKSEDGNVTSGDVLMIETTNSFVRSGDRLVAVVGMSDVVVVDTPDALLVTTRQNSQKVKKLVEKLTSLKRQEIVDHRRWSLDWGKMTQLAQGRGYDLHMFAILPDAAVPFEPLAERRRVITVAGGNAVLTVGNVEHILTPGRTVEIGLGATAHLQNGVEAMQLVMMSCDSNAQFDEIRGLVDAVAMPAGKREYV